MAEFAVTGRAFRTSNKPKPILRVKHTRDAEDAKTAQDTRETSNHSIRPVGTILEY